MHDNRLPERLTVARIRRATFPIVRRGYEPDQVRQLLARIAVELGRLHRRLVIAYAENDRIKRHLRQWQQDHIGCHRVPEPEPSHPPNRARWPINQASPVRDPDLNNPPDRH